MAAPRVGARVREGARTGVVVELRPQGMVDVRFEDRGIVERRPAAALALANPSPRAAKPPGGRGKPAPAPTVEVYDPTLEQFRSVVQGIYESLVCKETGVKAFKTATGLRADRGLPQATVRSLLSKAHAIATRVGQRHGYLEAGSQRPTLKGAALSAARYGADSRFVEKMLGEDEAGKKLAAGKSAATRASNREDYEKTLQLARKEQKPRRVLERQEGQLRLIAYPRKPNPTPWEARGERSVVAGSGATLPPEMRAYSDKARALGQGHGQALRALAHAKDKKPLLATAADFEHQMRLLIREATDSVDPMSPVWWEDNGKPTSRLRTALGTLNAVYVRTSEDVLAGRVRNPVKGKTRGVGIAGVGYAGTGGTSKGSGSGEYTPTTFYAVSQVADPEGIGYYLVTFDPKVRKVREALSRVGGWQLERTITGTAYETGQVSTKDAPKLHRVVGYSKGGRVAPRAAGGRFGPGYYGIVGPKAKPGEHFVDKKDADEYARWLDAKAASFLVPKAHDVFAGRYVSGDPGPYYKVTDLNGKDLEDEVASRKKKLEIMEGRGDTLREDSDLWAEMIYPDEASAWAAAKALDWRAANKGALPITGYRTKKGLSGKKATELYEKTLLAFEGRIPYVLHASLQRAEERVAVRAYKLGELAPKGVSTVPVLSVALLRNMPTTVFAFGDNMEQKGKGGQAVVRGEPNAVGIPTKWAPSTKEEAYFTDADFSEVRASIDAAVSTLRRHLLEGRSVVLPEDGVGTGLAELPKRAPKIYAYIKGQLEGLKKVPTAEGGANFRPLVLSKTSTSAEEARRKKQGVERLRATYLGRGESKEKLSAITEEASERGRKKLRNLIVRIAEAQAVQRVKEAAPAKYAAVMAKPRAEAEMRFRRPGSFNVPGRAYDTPVPSGATKLASDWEHLAENIWPKGNIPEKFQPAYTREMLDDLDLDDLREIASSKEVGLSEKEITHLLTTDERAALAKVLAEQRAVSPLAYIEAGTERGERRYKPPKPLREARALPLSARGAPSRKVSLVDSEGFSAEDRRRLAEIEKELAELRKMRKNGAVSTGVRFAKTGGELALRYGGKAAQAAKGWAASAEGKRAITRIAMTAASLFGAKAVEGGKLSASQARLVQQELERQTGHKADPADVALALQLASK